MLDSVASGNMRKASAGACSLRPQLRMLHATHTLGATRELTHVRQVPEVPDCADGCRSREACTPEPATATWNRGLRATSRSNHRCCGRHRCV